MSDCIFCRMVDGGIPNHTVHEDESTLAFLDVNPLARGHTLVVPKGHHERVNDLPADLATDLFGAAHALTDRVEAAVDADATTIAVNNGTAAGQEVPHVHVHIVPRFEGDGGRPIHALVEGSPEMDDDELASLASDISSS